jgi:hypothetical protein
MQYKYFIAGYDFPLYIRGLPHQARESLLRGLRRVFCRPS